VYRYHGVIAIGAPKRRGEAPGASSTMISPEQFNAVFMGNPVFKSVISPKTRPDGIVGLSGLSRSKNPCGSSGTSEPAASPVVPLFPRPPEFRGHNFRKMRNRAGIIKRSPAGTDEVIFSNVMMTGSRRGCGLGRGRGAAGGYACLLLGNVRDKEEFSRAIFSIDRFLKNQRVFNVL
jgi:hypothetical protein